MHYKGATLPPLFPPLSLVSMPKRNSIDFNVAAFLSFPPSPPSRRQKKEAIADQTALLSSWSVSPKTGRKSRRSITLSPFFFPPPWVSAVGVKKSADVGAKSFFFPSPLFPPFPVWSEIETREMRGVWLFLSPPLLATRNQGEPTRQTFFSFPPFFSSPSFPLFSVFLAEAIPRMTHDRKTPFPLPSLFPSLSYSSRWVIRRSKNASWCGC